MSTNICRQKEKVLQRCQ